MRLFAIYAYIGLLFFTMMQFAKIDMETSLISASIFGVIVSLDLLLDNVNDIIKILRKQ